MKQSKSIHLFHGIMKILILRATYNKEDQRSQKTKSQSKIEMLISISCKTLAILQLRTTNKHNK